MHRRRFFVTAFFAALAATVLPGRSGAAVPPALPDPIRLRRLPSGHFLVNGWVLTARDLEGMARRDR